MRDAQKEAALEQFDHFKQTQAFNKLKEYYSIRKRIRNDKILWKAHTSKEEFFSVGITMTNQMLTNKQQVEDATLTKKGTIEIKLGIWLIIIFQF